MTEAHAAPPLIVVMGVAGSGKSTLGPALAEALGVPFEEGDALHPAANIDKMAAGVPLSAADRQPWLDEVAAWISSQADSGGVVSCSALRRSYRDRLRGAGRAVLRFVLLAVSASVLRARLAQRRGHFLPGSLLESQLATLEMPDGNEADILVIDGTLPITDEIAQIMQWVR